MNTESLSEKRARAGRACAEAKNGSALLTRERTAEVVLLLEDQHAMSRTEIAFRSGRTEQTVRLWERGLVCGPSSLEDLLKSCIKTKARKERTNAN